MARPVRTRFYFSLRSPYSWLAYRDLVEQYPDVLEVLEWIPFWEPDKLTQELLAEHDATLPYTDMSRAKNLYILQDVKRLTTARGLSVTWPVDRDPVWEVPHLGYLVARAAGRGPEYVAATYRARWHEGRDICSPTTIGEIGVQIGLSPEPFETACDDPDLRREGVRELLHACDDGVFGVPFFTRGFSRFWGVDRLADFAELVRASGAGDTAVPAPAAGPVALGISPDDGHAGGCG